MTHIFLGCAHGVYIFVEKYFGDSMNYLPTMNGLLWYTSPLWWHVYLSSEYFLVWMSHYKNIRRESES